MNIIGKFFTTVLYPKAQTKFVKRQLPLNKNTPRRGKRETQAASVGQFPDHRSNQVGRIGHRKQTGAQRGCYPLGLGKSTDSSAQDTRQMPPSFVHSLIRRVAWAPPRHAPFKEVQWFVGK